MNITRRSFLASTGCCLAFPYPLVGKTISLDTYEIAYRCFDYMRKTAFGEINDDWTRAKITLMFESFIYNTKQNHVISYRVDCNRINNTPKIVDEGNLICDLYFNLDDVYNVKRNYKPTIFNKIISNVYFNNIKEQAIINQSGRVIQQIFRLSLNRLEDI